MGTARFSGSFGRVISVKKLSVPLASYWGTPKTCSDRNESAAIRSAVADLPKGHILRVLGACVETWGGGGRQAFLEPFALRRARQKASDPMVVF